jgi:DNA modification methylase
LCHGKKRFDHPTQKATRINKDLVRKHSNEGDLVLDTFAGTGTTAHKLVII